jgi:hypothetical protein
MLTHKKSFECNCWNVIVLIILTIITILHQNAFQHSFDDISTIRIVVIFLIIYQLFIIRRKKLHFFDFAVAFTFTNYLFVESYLFIWEKADAADAYWRMDYTAQQWNQAFLYGLCYIHGMFTGLTWKDQVSGLSLDKINAQNKNYSNKMVFLIGLILFILTLPCKIYIDALTIVSNRANQVYSAILTADQVNGVVFNGSLLVNVAVIYIIASKRLSKKTAIIFFTLFFAYALGITTMAGGRRFTVTAFISTFPCLLYCYNIKLKKKHVFIMATSAYLGLLFLKTVSATRHDLARSPIEYLELAMNYVQGNDVFFDAIAEFGNTIFPYIIALDYFPNYADFIWGKSLIIVWIAAIPTIGKIFPTLIHDSSVTAMVATKYRYWFGGALGQEIYGNFGYLAIGLAIPIGILFHKLLGLYDSRSPISVARYFSMFYILLNLVRSDLNEFTRLIIWALILPILIQNVLKRLKR